jgi:hypothetical protein
LVSGSPPISSTRSIGTPSRASMSGLARPK